MIPFPVDCVWTLSGDTDVCITKKFAANLTSFQHYQIYLTNHWQIFILTRQLFISILLSIHRECVSRGAAGARTRRSLGHHLLHPLILRLLVLCAPADFETQSSPGCTCTCRSKFLTHSLIHKAKNALLPIQMITHEKNDHAFHRLTLNFTQTCKEDYFFKFRDLAPEIIESGPMCITDIWQNALKSWAVDPHHLYQK